MSLSAETKILFVGDMHLGKLPTSLPDGLPAAELGPRAAWSRVVAAAIEHKVHCVALAGDLVERDNALFEAYGLLDPGVRELAAQGIAICAVAGNHDTEALPKLADQIDAFHLLGPGGTWSTFTVGGAPRVRLAGWSFPTLHHYGSPLESPAPPPEPGVTNFGLLHADLDVGSSKYAPITRRELEAVGYEGWFLGHVHLPGPVPNGGAPFYLGSVTALTPNERGLHGPVLVSVGSDGSISRRRLPLAPLRWEELTIDCSGMVDPGKTITAKLLAAVRKLREDLADELDSVLALGLRLVLTGRIDQPVELKRAVDRIDLADLQIPGAAQTVFIQKISNRVTGSIDLPQLAGQDHPAGILARQILMLQDAAVPGRDELLRLARTALDSVDLSDAFAALQGDEETEALSDAQLADLLLDTANQALDHLLAAKEDDRASF